MDTPLRLIVGLGNPGPEYEHTRHNAGADLVSQLAQIYETPLSPETKFFGNVARVRIGKQDIRLLNPTTFMNRSGQAVRAITQFYKIPTEAILIVYDELDLPPGTPRLKLAGGHGGHNGIRDIIQALGNDRNFARLRLGVGHPGSAQQVASYILKKASPSEQKLIDDSIDAAIKVIPLVADGEWNTAMKLLHTQNTP